MLSATLITVVKRSLLLRLQSYISNESILQNDFVLAWRVCDRVSARFILFLSKDQVEGVESSWKSERIHRKSIRFFIFWLQDLILEFRVLSWNIEMYEFIVRWTFFNQTEIFLISELRLQIPFQHMNVDHQVDSNNTRQLISILISFLNKVSHNLVLSQFNWGIQRL